MPSVESSQEVRCVDPLSLADWDELVLVHPGATIFHSRAWAQVLSATYDHQPHYLAVGDETRIDALLPLMEVRSRLTGTKAVSLPFTDVCQPLGNREPVQALYESALQFGNETAWR